MSVTVVVPTRDRPEQLAGCLAALRPQLRDGDELLVVDSAGHRRVAGALRVDRPGASRARNAGWRAAAHDLVAFLDDDVRVAPGWRAALDDAVEGVDVACGRVAVPPGQEGVERPVAVTPEVPTQLVDPDSTEVLGVSANLVARCSALADVGGFDERLGPGTGFCAAEDVELLDRLLVAGHLVRYAPSLLAFHEQWRTRRELLRLDYGYGKGAGARAVLAGGARGRRLAREALWEQGIAPVPGDLRRGYQYGVATGVVRAAGALAGLAAASVRLRP